MRAEPFSKMANELFGSKDFKDEIAELFLKANHIWKTYTSTTTYPLATEGTTYVNVGLKFDYEHVIDFLITLGCEHFDDAAGFITANQGSTTLRVIDLEPNFFIVEQIKGGGQTKITREQWHKIWTDRQFREVLKKVRALQI